MTSIQMNTLIDFFQGFAFFPGEHFPPRARFLFPSPLCAALLCLYRFRHPQLFDVKSFIGDYGRHFLLAVRRLDC